MVRPEAPDRVQMTEGPGDDARNAGYGFEEDEADELEVVLALSGVDRDRSRFSYPLFLGQGAHEGLQVSE